MNAGKLVYGLTTVLNMLYTEPCKSACNLKLNTSFRMWLWRKCIIIFGTLCIYACICPSAVYKIYIIVLINTIPGNLSKMHCMYAYACFQSKSFCSVKQAFSASMCRCASRLSENNGCVPDWCHAVSGLDTLSPPGHYVWLAKDQIHILSRLQAMGGVHWYDLLITSSGITRLHYNELNWFDLLKNEAIWSLNNSVVQYIIVYCT